MSTGIKRLQVFPVETADLRSGAADGRWARAVGNIPVSSCETHGADEDGQTCLSLISVFRWRTHAISDYFSSCCFSVKHSCRSADEGALRTHWPSLIICRLFLAQKRLPQLTLCKFCGCWTYCVWIRIKLHFFTHHVFWDRLFLVSQGSEVRGDSAVTRWSCRASYSIWITAVCEERPLKFPFQNRALKTDRVWEDIASRRQTAQRRHTLWMLDVDTADMLYG